MSDAATVTALSRVLSDYVARTAPSLVSIRAGRSGTSGFVWRPGLIVTAEEPLPEEDSFAVVTAAGETLTAQRAGRDPSTDIALLRVNRTDLPTVSLSSVPVTAGTLALAIGAEEGAPTAAFGVVSRSTGAWRSLRGGEIDARVELDVRLRRSAEGGLVLDAAGQAIGMAVLGPRRRTLVVPSATIERVANTLATHGRIARGYLGLGMQPV
ncbi:MAG TPA: S1C family serine protease, partial [Acetobacteraceae bacterium]|nr:S1C family serine protease [Acetobacteraceae bacterium]